MILSRDEIENVAGMTDGSLADVPFAILLTAIGHRGGTLLLELRRRQLEKRIIFENGTPVDCRSNLAHETLGRFIVSIGRLSESASRDAYAQAAARGVPLGEILVERELVTATELYRILQQNLARKLLDGFTWREGTFSISNQIPDVESPLKVRVPQLVLTGVAKFAHQEDIDRAIAPLVGKQLVLHPEPLFPIDELRLNRAQARLASVIEQGKRIDELADATDLSWELVSRIVCALSVIGVVTSLDSLPAGTKPGRAAFSPIEDSIPGTIRTPQVEEPSPGAATSLEPSVAEAIRNDVMQTYLSFRKRDAFELFGLDEAARPGDLDIAYLEFASRYAPWEFTDTRISDLTDKASEVFLAGARAYAVLASPSERSALLSKRRESREEKPPIVAADRFQIKTDLLDPELQYLKGKELADAGKHAEAISYLEFAADCDAQNGIYLAELAWTRFQQSPIITTGGRSLGELGEAMRIDPGCGLSWYYAGMIHARLGDPGKAEKFLSASIKKMAPDRRPIDALKSLK